MNKKAIIAVTLLGLFLLAAPSSTSAQMKAQPRPENPAIKAKPLLVPDLVVVSIDFKSYKTYSSGGVLKGSMLPSVTYKNQGNAPSGSFKLAWEYFDYGTNSWKFWLQSTYLTNSLAAGASFTEGGHLSDEFTWTIGAQWPKFRCRLDVQNNVTESNENNNEMTKSFR